MQMRTRHGIAALALVLALPVQAADRDREPQAESRESLAERVRARGREILDRLVESGAPGASAALVLPDGRVLAVSSGRADEEAELPMTPEHRMLSGSVGKTYVTAAAHQLVHAGELDLDAAAAEYFGAEDVEWLARVPNARDVTVRQLLQHTTGIPRYVFEREFTEQLTAEPDRVWRPEELLSYVFDHEPLFPPGEGWAYADTNYIIVGILIEKVSGRTFYDYVCAELLEPHDLQDTVPTDRRDIPRMAQGYVVAGRQMGIPELTLEGGEFVFNVQFEWCGGGWANTPSDLARWAGILYSGKAFEAPYLETLLDTVEAAGLGPGVGYGLGAMVRTTPAGRLVYHDGFMPGYLTTTGYFPEARMAAALQVNTDDFRALGKPLAQVMVEWVEAAREELER